MKSWTIYHSQIFVFDLMDDLKASFPELFDLETNIKKWKVFTSLTMCYISATLSFKKASI